MKRNLLALVVISGFVITVFVWWQSNDVIIDTVENVSATLSGSADGPTDNLVVLTGTYVCLPLSGGGVSATDCAFGIRTEDGKYYAVNFGAGAGSMADFNDGAQITAKGTIIESANLNPNSWSKFQSEGLFTILERP